MALTNIDYGSLASSETMNKNFMYLDDRITTVVSDFDTTVSSILSNIATINSRLSDLSETITESTASLDSSILTLKSKTEATINKASMVPDWINCKTVTLTKYTAPSNGYILLGPLVDKAGNITVNNKTYVLKEWYSHYDNTAELVAFPVKKGDVITVSVSLSRSLFLPITSFKLDESI